MSEPSYDSESVMRAVRAGAAEVLGPDSMTTGLIVGNIAMQLMAGDIAVVDVPTPEAKSYKDSPNYALRAIRAKSPSDLLEILKEGADRLSKSVASYCTNEQSRGTENSQTALILTPYIFPEGSAGEKVVGTLTIRIEDDDEPHYSMDGIASIWLQGGEDAPYNPLAERKQESNLSRSISFRRNSIKDPITGEDREVIYLETDAYYSGRGFSGDEGKLHEARFGNPIGAKGRILMVDLFYALDAAIKHYEDVYITFNKHVGLSYSDFRDADCLDEDLKLDYRKAEAFVRSLEDDSDRSSELKRNREDAKVQFDPKYIEEIREYKQRLRDMILAHARVGSEA